MLRFLNQKYLLVLRFWKDGGADVSLTIFNYMIKRKSHHLMLQYHFFFEGPQLCGDQLAEHSQAYRRRGGQSSSQLQILGLTKKKKKKILATANSHNDMFDYESLSFYVLSAKCLEYKIRIVLDSTTQQCIYTNLKQLRPIPHQPAAT